MLIQFIHVNTCYLCLHMNLDGSVFVLKQIKLRCNTVVRAYTPRDTIDLPQLN